jgi:ubiquinone biosynthesis monooxygenase Coq7
VREEMREAAAEEVDHLVWTEERLRQLGSRPSLLNPAWYGMSFALGALAGAVGDAVSLGFVAATEERVCQHLKDHLKQLPESDRRSQLILQQMLEDEERHGENALAAGGPRFPATREGRHVPGVAGHDANQLPRLIRPATPQPAGASIA